MVIRMDGKVYSFDGWLNGFLVGTNQWLDDWLAALMDGSIDIWIKKYTWIFIQTER
jgi:hypothetical protein